MKKAIENIPFNKQVLKISGIPNKSNIPEFCSKYHVVENLAWVSKFTFDKDYLEFCRGRNSLINLFEENSELSSSLLLAYQAVLNSTQGFDSFNKKYPVLKELMVSQFSNLNEYLTEITKTFENDRLILSKELNKDILLSEIVKIDTNSGDVHKYGKSTAIIKLSCGTTLVYKPRSGELDLAFNYLLKEVNKEVGNIELKLPKVISNEEYSWVEYIEHLSCKSDAEVLDYYRNSGALLAIVYLLNGTDMHYENIIAHGKHPVLIDLECLFNFTDTGSYNIFSSGLIPTSVTIDTSTTPLDGSGFGACGTQKSASEIWKWKNLNSDNLHLDKVYSHFTADKNQPVLNGKRVAPKNFLQEILSGFEGVCQWVLNSRKNWLNSNPFSVFEDKTIRIIVRPTRTYKNILENSYIPQSLESRESRIKTIKKYLNDFPLPDHFNKSEKKIIIKYECDAIERMDIPYFTASTSGLYIKESNHLILNNHYDKPPYVVIEDKIQNLSQQVINQQTDLIKSAFGVRYHTKMNEPSLLNKACSDKPEEIISQIADAITKQAQKSDSSLFWNTIVTKASNHSFIDLLNNSLYSGSLGIAFFLSAIDEYKKSSKYQGLIDSIVCQNFDKIMNSDELKNDISLSNGVSGLIYAMIRISFDKYETEIHQLTELITPSLILRDKVFDIMTGSAGCLVVLTKLYEKTESKEILNKIEFIANYLLESATLDEKTGCRIWISGSFDSPLTGFSHGVSGIGLGLLKVFKITNQEVYKNAYLEAVNHENFFFNNEQHNWLDLRNNKDSYQVMWCHGSPGIGLSRLYGYQILKEKSLLNDIMHATKSVISFPFHEKDYYCCGNTGRIDFLFEAARVLKDDNLERIAKSRLKQLTEIRTGLGCYLMDYSSNLNLKNPSLFKGLSGIGYTYLRCLDSDKFPCIGLFN